MLLVSDYPARHDPAHGASRDADHQGVLTDREHEENLVVVHGVTTTIDDPRLAATDASDAGVAARRRTAGLALLALATGAFAIGTTEFVSMGLLPQLAAGVGVDIPTAGHVISAYALGVVVGAPVLAVLRCPPPAPRAAAGADGRDPGRQPAHRGRPRLRHPDGRPVPRGPAPRRVLRRGCARRRRPRRPAAPGPGRQPGDDGPRGCQRPGVPAATWLGQGRAGARRTASSWASPP